MSGASQLLATTTGAPAETAQFGFRIDPDAYYIETETAALLKISAHTLRRRRQTRSDLAFCKHGARVYYRGADIIAALEASRRTSTSDNGSKR